MLILTLTLGHLEGRTLLMIFNFRPYYGYVQTKRLPFVETDKIWNLYSNPVPSKWPDHSPRILTGCWRNRKRCWSFFFFSGYRCLSFVLVVQHLWPCFKSLFSPKGGLCELGNVQCDWKDRLVSVFLFRISECVFVICKGKNIILVPKMYRASHFSSYVSVFIRSMSKPLGIKYFWTGYNLEQLKNQRNLPTSHSLFLKQWGNTFTEISSFKERMWWCVLHANSYKLYLSANALCFKNAHTQSSLAWSSSFCFLGGGGWGGVELFSQHKYAGRNLRAILT